MHFINWTALAVLDFAPANDENKPDLTKILVVPRDNRLGDQGLKLIDKQTTFSENLQGLLLYSPTEVELPEGLHGKLDDIDKDETIVVIVAMIAAERIMKAGGPEKVFGRDVMLVSPSSGPETSWRDVNNGRITYSKGFVWYNAPDEAFLKV